MIEEWTMEIPSFPGKYYVAKWRIHNFIWLKTPIYEGIVAIEVVLGYDEQGNLSFQFGKLPIEHDQLLMIKNQILLFWYGPVEVFSPESPELPKHIQARFMLDVI